MSGTRRRPARDRRIELTLPVSVGRLGVHSRRVAMGAAVLTVVLVAGATVALAVGGDNPAPSAKPAAAERNDTQTPVGDLLAGGSYPQPALSGDTGAAGVPPRTSPRPTAPVTGTGAVADVGQTGTYAGGAGTLTPAGIATLAMAAGCSPNDATIATAVAIAESGGSPAAQGDTTLMDSTWDWSAGLWQIRGLRAQRDTGGLRDSIANHDPVTNAAAMYSISGGCSNWGPWTTFTRGDYRAFLGIAERAVNAVVKYRNAHGGTLPPVAPRDPNATVPIAGGGIAGDTNPAARSTKPTSGRSKPNGTSPTSSSSPSGAPTGSSGGSAGSGGSGGSGSQPSDQPTGQSSPTKTKQPILPTKLPALPTKLPTSKLPTTLPTLPSLPTKLPGL